MNDVNKTTSMIGLSLQDLCELQPDDPTLHIQLARQFMREDREVASLYAAKKAYNILIQEMPEKAAALVQEFGYEILSTSMHPLVSEIYLPLKTIFGTIASACRRFKLNNGDALFWGEEESDYIYLLVEGELAINSEINGQLVLLNYLHAGGLVGESVMEVEGKRMATVIANKNCQLIRFTRDELFQAFEQHPDLLTHFLKEMMLRKHVTKLSYNPLFSKLPMDLRFIIANRVESKYFNLGSTIQSMQDKNEETISMIVSGIVHLYSQNLKAERVYCGRLTTGQMFGLDKLLDAFPSGMIYVAETECEILDIDLNVIRDVMQISQSFAEKIRNESLMFSQQLTHTILLQNKIQPNEIQSASVKL